MAKPKDDLLARLAEAEKQIADMTSAHVDLSIAAGRYREERDRLEADLKAEMDNQVTLLARLAEAEKERDEWQEAHEDAEARLTEAMKWLARGRENPDGENSDGETCGYPRRRVRPSRRGGPAVKHSADGGLRQVWKYVVPIPDEKCRSHIECPIWSEFISVGIEPDMLADQIVVWAMVDPTGEMVRHRLVVANTGVEIPNHPNGDIRFLGTVRTSNGIVWHVWDEDVSFSGGPSRDDAVRDENEERS